MIIRLQSLEHDQVSGSDEVVARSPSGAEGRPREDTLLLYRRAAIGEVLLVETRAGIAGDWPPPKMQRRLLKNNVTNSRASTGPQSGRKISGRQSGPLTAVTAKQPLALRVQLPLPFFKKIIITSTNDKRLDSMTGQNVDN